MVEKLFQELAELPVVEAIALGGSRAGTNFDEKSDYDVYLYCTGAVPEEKRREILGRYCAVMEIGNHFWEPEDNCTLKNGVDIDVLYRDLEDFSTDIASVVEEHQARNGYTTCMWHNLRTCQVVYDRDGRLTRAKERFEVPYPAELKRNIIRRNWQLVKAGLPAYSEQIRKAVVRGDLVSVNHRTAAFLESYFDILFALNEKTHPGEKRLVELSKQECEILPEGFEENLKGLFANLFSDGRKAMEHIEDMAVQLRKVIKEYI